MESMHEESIRKYLRKCLAMQCDWTSGDEDCENVQGENLYQRSPRLASELQSTPGPSRIGRDTRSADSHIANPFLSKRPRRYYPYKYQPIESTFRQIEESDDVILIDEVQHEEARTATSRPNAEELPGDSVSRKKSVKLPCKHGNSQDHGSSTERITNRDNGTYSGRITNGDNGTFSGRITNGDNATFTERITNGDNGTYSGRITNGDNGTSSGRITNGDNATFIERITNGDNATFTERITNGDNATFAERITNGDIGTSTERITNGDIGTSTERITNGDNATFTERITNGDNGTSTERITNGDNETSTDRITNGDNGNSTDRITNGDNGNCTDRITNGDNGNSTENDDKEPTEKELNQDLLHLLECPVCLECMEPPLAQCRRGHLVCHSCRLQINVCPICRTTFSANRNRAMERVAELVLYPCRHECGKRMRLRRRLSHEDNCVARRYSCPMNRCSVLQPPVPHEELVQHIKSIHNESIKIGEEQRLLITTACRKNEWMLLAHHELFQVRTRIEQGHFDLYVAYIGPKCNTTRYIYEVTVQCKSKARRVKYSRYTHSDQESCQQTLARQDCFHLSVEQVVNMQRDRDGQGSAPGMLDLRLRLIDTHIHECETSCVRS